MRHEFLIFTISTLLIQFTICDTNFKVKGLSVTVDLNTLIHVHVVWRHGDRSPSILIPTDKGNGIKTWPDGLGEITRKGLQQQYALGQLIRARYDGFLSKHYSPFEVYIRSSDFNRTLTSAQANLAGMFPPDKNEQFVEGLNWRPIPVHTMPKHEDKELYDKAACPHADSEEDIVYNSDEIRKVEDDSRELLTFLGSKSGYTNNTPMRLREMWKLFDPLWAEFCHSEDHRLPSWVNETIRKQIFELYHFSSSHLYGSPLLKRLRAGPLFGEIINRIKSYSIGRVDPREKLYVYSAHDTAIAAVLAGFDVTPTLFPEYATAVFVELHNTTDGYIVQVFYKNDTNSNDIYELELPQCSSPCTVDELIHVSLDVLPTNWSEECGLYQVVFPHFYFYLIFAAMVSVAIMIATIVRAYRYRMLCVQNRSPNYKLLIENGDHEF
ncbi:hypothetical protein M3Y94_00358200 [Aphelenchoides besseyi]|nr:hypothetical protein M3Y94_00358200 [Aphelenchoides besseyi]KAI6235282.1 Histidine phosphatase superfamily, clade-2-containing protein [Aphelenchoides besseyi]